MIKHTAIPISKNQSPEIGKEIDHILERFDNPEDALIRAYTYLDEQDDKDSFVSCLIVRLSRLTVLSKKQKEKRKCTCIAGGGDVNWGYARQFPTIKIIGM